MKIASLLLPLFVAGMLCAQTTPAAAHHRRPMLQKLTAELNLTADQQAQAKAIFQKSWEQRKALAPKLREERAAMFNAVKTDNEQQIDQLLQKNSQLNAQAREIQAKAMAKFYAILNPDQKAKMDQKLDRTAHRTRPANGSSR